MGDRSVPIPLVVGGDDEPRGRVGGRLTDHPAVGRLVILPLPPHVEILLRELPAIVVTPQPTQEPVPLLVVRNVEHAFDDRRSTRHDLFIQLVDDFDPVVYLVGCGPLLSIAPEEVVLPLIGGRLGETRGAPTPAGFIRMMTGLIVPFFPEASRPWRIRSSDWSDSANSNSCASNSRSGNSSSNSSFASDFPSAKGVHSGSEPARFHQPILGSRPERISELGQVGHRWALLGGVHRRNRTGLLSLRDQVAWCFSLETDRGVFRRPDEVAGQRVTLERSRHRKCRSTSHRNRSVDGSAASTAPNHLSPTSSSEGTDPHVRAVLLGSGCWRSGPGIRVIRASRRLTFRRAPRWRRGVKTQSGEESVDAGPAATLHSLSCRH